MSDVEVTTVDAAGHDPASTPGRMENRVLWAIGQEISQLAFQFTAGQLSADKFLLESEVRTSNFRAVRQNLGVRHCLARAETLMLRETLSDCAERIAEITEALQAGMADRGVDPDARAGGDLPEGR
jgi:hypothetical protein